MRVKGFEWGIAFVLGALAATLVPEIPRDTRNENEPARVKINARYWL